jgi:hypothetical protein
MSINCSDSNSDSLFVRGDLIKPRQNASLWSGRIGLASLNAVIGDPEAAKTTSMIDIAARTSTGEPMPGCDVVLPPAGVVWAGYEDDASTTREMLRVAGADLKRVLVFEKRQGDLLLPESVSILRRAIIESSARLVVLDPVSAFFPCNSENVVRRALTPLGVVAEETGAAIVLIGHLSKARARRSLLQGVGSVALVAAVRSALLIAREPGTAERRIAAHLKNNLGPLMPSLAFQVVSEANSRRIEWLGPSVLTADDVLAATSPDESSALEEAEGFLGHVLTPGPLWVKDIREAATAAGIAPTTLRRAKRRLKIKHRRHGFGKDSRVYWLPPAGEIAKRLEAREVDELMDQLVSGEPDPPDDATNSTSHRRRPPHVGDDDWQQQPT